jgi:hypothetical protein
MAGWLSQIVRDVARSPTDPEQGNSWASSVLQASVILTRLPPISAVISSSPPRAST